MPGKPAKPSSISLQKPLDVYTIYAAEKTVDGVGIPVLKLSLRAPGTLFDYAHPVNLNVNEVGPLMTAEQFASIPPQTSWTCDVDVEMRRSLSPFPKYAIVRIVRGKMQMPKPDEQPAEPMSDNLDELIPRETTPEPPPAPEPEKVIGLGDVPKPHWSDNPKNVEKFWQKVAGLAFDALIPTDQMHQWALGILGVDSLLNVPNGSEAVEKIRATLPKPEPASEPTKQVTPAKPLNPVPSKPHYEDEPEPSQIAMTVYQPANVSMLPEQAHWVTMREQAGILIKSGFLPSTVRTAEQAIAIMMMGEALNVKPIIALQSINVIQGKPTVSPQLMLALIRKSGQLQDLTVTDDGTTCTVTMTRKGETAHTETFSMTDAGNMGLAGKDNWRKQPAVMRKWRAISAACRVVFPDIILGFYTPEELAPDITFED